MADITFKGTPIQSISELPAVGSDAPDFEVTGDDLGEVKLSDFKRQKLVIGKAGKTHNRAEEMASHRLRLSAEHRIHKT